MAGRGDFSKRVESKGEARRTPATEPGAPPGGERAGKYGGFSLPPDMSADDLPELDAPQDDYMKHAALLSCADPEGDIMKQGGAYREKMAAFFAEHKEAKDRGTPPTCMGDLLGGNILFGEEHSCVTSKKFLIDNMQSFAEAGYGTMFCEHLFREHQAALDAFFRDSEEKVIPPETLKSLEALKVFMKDGLMPDGFIALLWAAKAANIRIVGIDTQSEYKMFPPKTVGGVDPLRQQSMNYVAHEIIQYEMKAHPHEKWLAFMGEAHLCEVVPGVLGMGELTGARAVHIRDREKIHEEVLPPAGPSFTGSVALLPTKHVITCQMSLNQLTTEPAVRFSWTDVAKHQILPVARGSIVQPPEHKLGGGMDEDVSAGPMVRSPGFTVRPELLSGVDAIAELARSFDSGKISAIIETSTTRYDRAENLDQLIRANAKDTSAKGYVDSLHAFLDQLPITGAGPETQSKIKADLSRYIQTVATAKHGHALQTRGGTVNPATGAAVAMLRAEHEPAPTLATGVRSPNIPGHRY